MDSSLQNTQTFEEVEAYLIGLGLYKLATVNTDKTSSVKHVFTKGKEVKEFMGKNNYFNTLQLDNNIQCTAGKRRSIGDIFRILKHYCPYITLEEVHTQLNNCDGTFGCIICGDINKRVWRSSYTYINCGNLDEYGFQYKANVNTDDNYLKFINVKG